MYAYLFAKRDRANIDKGELDGFRDLADIYGRKSDMEIMRELRLKELVEIWDAGQEKIQE